jgi:hypothetical protein
MVPTWAISVLDLILVASLAICSTATATALSMLFLISVGLAPDAVTLRRSRKIASVRTVAVVVPPSLVRVGHRRRAGSAAERSERPLH